MPDAEQLEIIAQGADTWNQWRQRHPGVRPALAGADLTGAMLRGANLDDADLEGATLSRANFTHAFFHRANLRGADLAGATLTGTNFCKARLPGSFLRAADCRRANFDSADLSRADLTGASLELAILVGATVEKTQFTGCRVYGISAWDLDLTGVADQSDLRITPDHEPRITVSNLEVAQFVYLMLHNPKIRGVIDTIGEKGVLILGRFTKERKAVLDRMRHELQQLGFVPMIFDFEAPTQKDFTETIMTLAGMSRFVIADITNPRSAPLELRALVPEYRIPFVPIIQKGEKPFAMFQDLRRDWLLDVLEYVSTDDLIRVFRQAVVSEALRKSNELMTSKLMEIRTRQTSDYD